MKRDRQDRGIALVVVLWVSLLVAAIAGAFVVDTGTGVRVTRNFMDDAEARALADGGVHLAVFELLSGDDTTRPQRDGRIYRRTVPGGVLEYAVEDEAGKINLNQADRALLEGLFLSQGTVPSVARALMETIDGIRSGDAPQERLLRSVGASTDRVGRIADAIDATRRRLRGYGTRVNARPFIAVDALGQLPGITADLYARVRPALTVYGENTGLRYLTAPRRALQAVPGVPAEAVEQFLAERTEAETPAPLENFLSQGQARNFADDGESDFVTVKVLAHADSGGVFARIAIVDLAGRPGAPFIVREWREGDATMFQTTPAPAAPARRGGTT